MKLGMVSSISTKRCFLRPFTPDDIYSFYRLKSNPELYLFLDQPPLTSLEQANELLQKLNQGVESGSWLFWAITRLDQNDVIGTICLWNFSLDRKIAEVGYDMHPDYQGSGYMKEALLAITYYGLHQLGLDQILAYTHFQNEKSVYLLKHCGYQMIKLHQGAEKYDVYGRDKEKADF